MITVHDADLNDWGKHGEASTFGLDDPCNGRTSEHFILRELTLQRFEATKRGISPELLPRNNKYQGHTSGLILIQSGQ